MLMIIDYGVGNVGSIKNMFNYVGGDAHITSDPTELSRATKIVLPGVGKFGHAMRQLGKYGWIAPLNDCALTKKIPILGICLGMQLMTRGSEESPEATGLGWIEADTVRFPFTDEDKLKLPHMGWNMISPQGSSLLLDRVNGEQRFYFVHSYHVQCDNKADVAGVTQYGGVFTSCIQKNNLFGFQPHPEKSHKFGMNAFRRFLVIGEANC